MRYISFTRVASNGQAGRASYGSLSGDVVTDLGATPGAPADLKAALVAGTLAGLTGPQLALSDVTLLPVIPNPGKILCVGLNYATHVAETGREQKEHPTARR